MTKTSQATNDQPEGRVSLSGRSRAGTTRRKGLRSRGVVMSAITAGALLAACGSSAAKSSSSSTASGPATTSGSSSAVASALSYFKGKTITLIAPDGPGGDYDLYARILAPAFGQYLGATVNVENVPGGGTVVGGNQIASAAPNGLTLGLFSVGGDEASVIENHPGQNFTLTKLSWIGQPGTSPSVFLTQPNSSVTSFAQLLTTKTPINVVDIRNGTGDMLDRVVLGAFKIPNKLLTGFTSVATLKQGFLAHDGQFLFENLPPFKALIQGNQAKPLLVTSPAVGVLSGLVAGVPTLSSELSKVSLSSAQQAAVKEAVSLATLAFDMGGPPGIPSARLTVLRDAFNAAVTNSATLAQATKESEPIDPINGATVATDVAAAVSQGPSIATYLNG